MWRAFVSLGHIAVDFLFPRLCCGCGERVFESCELVCPRCLKSVRQLTQPLCPVCGMEDAPAGRKCEHCPAGEIFFSAARAVAPYEGVARTIVERLKYNYREEYAPWMAMRMLEVARSEFAHVAFDAVVPVPLHRTRRRERGFNQSELLARPIAKAFRVPLAVSALRRVRNTPSQTKLSKRERAENIREAFSVPDPPAVQDKVFLLVDDVYTTGATLNECARVLRAGGARDVYCLSFCRATLHSFAS
ncbi:MAG: ComF family protein [Candidatus Sumerlaea chitinivorans]|nr:ComF family protein [Candidatus Sumerlaea chitinivorans]